MVCSEWIIEAFWEIGHLFPSLSLGGINDCSTVAHISFFSWKCHSLLVMEDAGFAYQSCSQLLVRMGNSGPQWGQCGTDMGMLLTPALFHLLFSFCQEIVYVFIHLANVN